MPAQGGGVSQKGKQEPTGCSRWQWVYGGIRAGPGGRAEREQTGMC